MQLEGGGSTAPKKKAGGGTRRPAGPPLPGRSAPAPTPSLPRFQNGGVSRQAPTIQKPPQYTDVNEWLQFNSRPKPFDVNAVSKAKAGLEKAETAVVTPDYSAYTNPHKLAAQNNDWAVRTPEQATELRDRRNQKMTGLSKEDLVDKARVNLEHALRAQREHALGLDSPNAEKHGDVKQMSWEQYQALDPKARAAIDFNTMLVRAVRRDKAMQDEYDPGDQQEKIYQKSVEKMFGEDGGADDDFYAPETMAVLRQIGYKDEASDLDDFLGLKAAITKADLKHVKIKQGPTAFEATGNPVAVDRAQLVNNLATKTQQLEVALAHGNELLQSVRATALNERNDLTEMMGGLGKDAKAYLGFRAPTDESGSMTIDGYFSDAFDTLARSDSKGKQGEIFARMSQDLSPEELDAFMRYADQRSGNAQRFNVDLGSGDGVKYVKPDQFRKMLGLDGGGKNASK